MLRTWLILLLLAALGVGLHYVVFLALQRGQGFDAFLDAMCRLDCWWYRGLAENGYATALSTSNRAAQTNWAFFPLFPIVAGLLRRMTGLSWEGAAMLTSTAALLLAAGCSAPLFRGNRRAFWLFAFLLLAGPFSYLGQAAYSEALFIMLAVLAFVALEQARPVRAGLWGALMAATRVTGIFFALALLADAIQRQVKAGSRWRSLPGLLLVDRKLWLALLLVPVGLLAYMLFLRLTVGDGLAFARIQMTWLRELHNPLVVWWTTVERGWPFRPSWGLLNTLALLVALAMWLVVAMVRTGRVAMAIFCVAALLISVGAGLGSSLRFIAGLAPFTVMAAELLARRRWLAWVAVPLGLLLGCAFAADWMLGDTLLA